MNLGVGIIMAIVCIQAEAEVMKDGMEGVVEQPIDGINYIPHEYNDSIGLQNVSVKPEKLLVRSSIDESSMIRWDIPNTEDNWSFSIDFNEPNLNASEFAGLYLFYTKEKPVVGGFKGANSVFHGFATGMEFTGKGVDLVYSKNNGLDYHNIDEYVSKMDSLNPQRFRSVDSLRMKVICTEKNFKVEIYDKERIIYDNFRAFTEEDLANHKAGRYFGIFADYKNVSSGKAFEIKQAQLYKRNESKDYSLTRLYMDRIPPVLRNKDEIAHPNVDVQDFIFKLNSVTNFAKVLLGELPETTLTRSEKELIKEMDVLNEKVERLKSMQRKQASKNEVLSRLNEFDVKIKKISKSISDIDYAIEDLNDKDTEKYSLLEYFTIFGGIGAMLVLLVKEISEYVGMRKRSNLKQ